jgi:hypothetical protein
MASQIDAFNLALTFLDISDTVQSINDNSPQAGVLNRFWDYARKRVLEFCWWDFATKSIALNLLLDQSTLALQSQLVFPGWRYIYGLPADCLRPLAVTTQYGMRLNPFTRSWWYDMSQAPQWGPYRPPWRKANHDGTNPNLTAAPGQIILTDQDSAWLVFVEDVTNVALWSQAFLEAVAWNMALPAAGPLSANQNAKKMAREESHNSMIRAMSLELNQSQPDPYPDSPAITARN